MDELKFKLSGVMKTHEDLLLDFEGPLDVILQLLSKNKMTIADLSISLILEQYLEHMQDMAELDLEMASEFTVMASHLVYLKSRMLLNAERDREDEDMALLMRALEERRNREAYEKILIAVAFLEPLSYIGRELYSKPPSLPVKDPIYRRRHEPEELKAAMDELRDRQARRAPPERAAFRGIVGSEPYPVKRNIDALLKRLSADGRASMMGLFREQGSRSELVAVFLAILELCKESRVSVEPSEGDILITLCAG